MTEDKDLELQLLCDRFFERSHPYNERLFDAIKKYIRSFSLPELMEGYIIWRKEKYPLSTGPITEPELINKFLTQKGIL